MVAAQLDFTLSTIAVRIPYWGEAEVLFDASRLRAHLPLYVDPFQGTAEVPPSRWYVTYPPLWAFVLSKVPASSALAAGRAMCGAAWFGTLALLGARRPIALACAAYVAGSWVLANFATVARPDSIACALAAWGLARALAKGRVDAAAALLLVLAPWVKPTLIGLPAGALLADALARRTWRPLLVAAAFATAIGAALEIGSGGVLLVDIARSNAQPFTLAAWLDHVPTRVPFFAPPIALAIYAARRSPIGLGAVVGATLWTLVALAKTGSASNYWMEPCIAAVVVVAYVPFALPRFTAPVALASVVYAGVAAVGGANEHRREYRDDAAFVRSVHCDGVVASDEAGIELVLDGRILVPTYQFSELVKAGRWPASIWEGDLRHAACFVEHTGQLPPEVRDAMGWRVREQYGRFRVLDLSAP